MQIDVTGQSVTISGEQLGRMALDAGADLVVGHHPHALQHVEAYGGGLICYSLGNFGVEHMNPQAGRESAVLQVVGDKDGIREARFRPIWIDDDSRPTPIALGDERSRAVAAMLRGSDESGLEEEKTSGWSCREGRRPDSGVPASRLGMTGSERQ